ncbi:MAG: ROK family protein, partial [Geobacter sp.]
MESSVMMYPEKELPSDPNNGTMKATHLTHPREQNMIKKSVVLGIDIGGTTSSFGFVEHDGTCLAETTLPTLPHEPAENLVERLCTQAREKFRQYAASHALKGIGIGAPNANYYT